MSVDILAVLDTAASALSYAGAKREGVEQVIAARSAVAELIAERDRLAAAPDPWQPIDRNTPKSETIMLGSPLSDHPSTGRWNFEHREWESDASDMPKPTHWMPLPPRPKA